MINFNFQQVKDNFNKRNIDFLYYEDKKQLLKDLTDLIEKVETIGIGNSKTLKDLKVFELSCSLGKTVYDKTLAKDAKDKYILKRKSLITDLYITSSNAISKDGKIINIDHSGNRVAAMTFGPKQVVVIVCENKLVENENEGLKRALKIATPLNAKRANYHPPCTENKSCTECIQSQRVCNYLSVIRGQHENNRMTVMMLKGSYGF